MVALVIMRFTSCFCLVTCLTSSTWFQTWNFPSFLNNNIERSKLKLLIRLLKLLPVLHNHVHGLDGQWWCPNHQTWERVLLCKICDKIYGWQDQLLRRAGPCSSSWGWGQGCHHQHKYHEPGGGGEDQEGGGEGPHLPPPKALANNEKKLFLFLPVVYIITWTHLTTHFKYCNYGPSLSPPTFFRW